MASDREGCVMMTSDVHTWLEQRFFQLDTDSGEPHAVVASCVLCHDLPEFSLSSMKTLLAEAFPDIFEELSAVDWQAILGKLEDARFLHSVFHSDAVWWRVEDHVINMVKMIMIKDSDISSIYCKLMEVNTERSKQSKKT